MKNEPIDHEINENDYDGLTVSSTNEMDDDQSRSMDAANLCEICKLYFHLINNCVCVLFLFI